MTHHRHVYLGPLPQSEDPDEFVRVRKSNDRHFQIALLNHGRMQRGTATLHRLLALYQGIAKRHPKWRKSPQSSNRMAITIRPRIGGPVITRN